jgi:hypothetical protein
VIAVGQEYREPGFSGRVWVVRYNLTGGVWHLTTKSECLKDGEWQHIARAIDADTLQKWERSV